MRKYLIILLFVSTPAAAQFDYNWSSALNSLWYSPPNACSGTPNCVTLDSEDDDDVPVENDILQQSQLSLKSLDFKPSLSRRNSNVEKFIARVRKIDPANAESLKQQLQSADILSAVQNVMATKGLDANNLADASALYWVVAWQASNGLSGDSSAQQMQAVRGQVFEVFRGVPKISEMTEAGMQEVAEEMLLTSAVISASLDVVKDDPARLKSYAAEIMKQSKANGLDFTELTLTDKGFKLVR